MTHTKPNPDHFTTALAELEVSIGAADLLPALRSAVVAILPGRQTRKNTADMMHVATVAFVRALRRRARARVRRHPAGVTTSGRIAGVPRTGQLLTGTVRMDTGEGDE